MTKELKETKNYKFLSILCSFIIMLAGGVVWGAVYATGFFSTWIALLSGFGAMLVYVKLNKNGKWGMFAYILVCSLIINFISMWLSLSISALSLAPELGFGGICKIAFQVLFGEAVSDTILCFVFTILGVCGGLGIVLSKNRQKKNIVTETNGTIQETQIQQNVEAQQNVDQIDDKTIYNDIIDNITVMIKGITDKSITTEEFHILFKKYKDNNIDILTEDQILALQICCLDPIEDKIKDKARKILLKTIAKK